VPHAQFVQSPVDLKIVIVGSVCGFHVDIHTEGIHETIRFLRLNPGRLGETDFRNQQDDPRQKKWNG
jgi:hypothetical protein